MPTPDTTKPKTSIFISYAREDCAIAYRLEAALLALGFTVLIDKTGIAIGEDWQKRIEGMILAADVVVFILSPDAVSSKVCNWEVDRTEQLKKRLLPIKWRPVEGLPLPPGLSRPNWGDFSEVERLGLDEKQAFDVPFAMLVEAIETNIGWVRQHTEFTARAERWKDAGRPADQFLLSGIEISNAQLWVSQRPEKERIPEDLHEFLKASLAKEERNREELNARERRISQEKQRLVGEVARRAREMHRYDSAMRLALAGEPMADELARGVVPEPSRRARLAAAAHAALNVAKLAGHSGLVRNAIFSADSAQIVTASDDKTARLWDAASGSQLRCFKHDGRVRTASFSSDRTRVATASDDNTARVWDAAGGAELVRLAHKVGVTSAVISPDGRQVVTTSDHIARVWDAVTGVELIRLTHAMVVDHAAFCARGVRLVTASCDGRPEYGTQPKALRSLACVMAPSLIAPHSVPARIEF